MNKEISRGYAKYIRSEKSKIRNMDISEKEQQEMIEQLYETVKNEEK